MSCKSCEGICIKDSKVKQFFYRKNVQGDIVAILDNAGKIVVNYTYDAWGNHTVADTTATHIGNLNPFRYRGYYYDVETELYFLKTRYYDPQIGRFITIDDLDYLDPENINGLNLYAYCVNNPVMNVDPTGTEPITILMVVASLLFSTFMGTMAGISGAAINNRHIGIGAAIGAIGGLLNGVGVFVAIGLGHPIVSVLVATIVAAASEYFNQVFNHEERNFISIFYSGFAAAITGGLSYFLVGRYVEQVVDLLLSYIITPVFYGIQTMFDTLFQQTGTLNWLNNTFNGLINWFNNLVNQYRQTGSGLGGGISGSSGGGGGGGGAGGR